MTSFDDREKGFENKFAHDGALDFKINARRNKLLGLWVAEKLGHSDREAYAKEVILADFEKPGHNDVLHKLMKDIKAAGAPITREEVCAEAERLLAVARTEIMKE